MPDHVLYIDAGPTSPDAGPIFLDAVLKRFAYSTHIVHDKYSLFSCSDICYIPRRSPHAGGLPFLTCVSICVFVCFLFGVS